MKNMKRASILFFLTAFILLGFGVLSGAGAADKGPIKIGFVAPKTGNFAQMGLDMISGAKLFLEEHGYKVAGRDVKIFWEDEGAGPESAVIKVRKLIKHDKVDLVAGVFLTSAAYAIAAACNEAETPLFITLSAGDDITQRKSTIWASRLSLTGCDIGHVGADYAYKEMQWKKAVTIALDYGWGHESTGGFQDVFENLGGKVIQKIWCPISTMDYGPYVASISKEADGIWATVTGAAAIRFIKSAREMKLFRKVEIMTPGSAFDETLLPSHGDNGLGIKTVLHYSAALPTPLNFKLKKLVKEKLNRDVAWGIETSWTGLSWVFKAIENIDGDVENKEKLAKALRAVEMEDSVRGPLWLDTYGHPIQNYYIRRVDKVGDRYQNTIIKTYQGVSQFWNSNPKEYLERPVYSRDYPPCKYCK